MKMMCVSTLFVYFSPRCEMCRSEIRNEPMIWIWRRTERFLYDEKVFYWMNFWICTKQSIYTEMSKFVKITESVPRLSGYCRTMSLNLWVIAFWSLGLYRLSGGDGWGDWRRWRCVAARCDHANWWGQWSWGGSINSPRKLRLWRWFVQLSLN